MDKRMKILRNILIALLMAVSLAGMGYGFVVVYAPCFMFTAVTGMPCEMPVEFKP